MAEPAIEGEVTARTKLGELVGRRVEGVACFRGVPYAGPTERFAPPTPLAPWTGVLDATTDGPIAPQVPSRLAHLMGDHPRPQAEDCLTLTVWTPAGG